MRNQDHTDTKLKAVLENKSDSELKSIIETNKSNSKCSSFLPYSKETQKALFKIASAELKLRNFRLKLLNLRFES